MEFHALYVHSVFPNKQLSTKRVVQSMGKGLNTELTALTKEITGCRTARLVMCEETRCKAAFNPTWVIY